MIQIIVAIAQRDGGLMIDGTCKIIPDGNFLSRTGGSTQRSGSRLLCRD